MKKTSKSPNPTNFKKETANSEILSPQHSKKDKINHESVTSQPKREKNQPEYDISSRRFQFTDETSLLEYLDKVDKNHENLLSSSLSLKTTGSIPKDWKDFMPANKGIQNVHLI